MNFFKMMGSLGNIGKIQQEMQAITEEMANLHFEGRAGGDMVVVQVNGQQQLTGCTIDPQLLSDGDKELLEDLVVAAVNDALTEAKRQGGELMQKKLSEKLNLPDLPGMMANFMPKP